MDIYARHRGREVNARTLGFRPAPSHFPPANATVSTWFYDTVASFPQVSAVRWVGRVGLEPTTQGLKVLYSAN
jgi:hypothetical protein